MSDNPNQEGVAEEAGQVTQDLNTESGQVANQNPNPTDGLSEADRQWLLGGRQSEVTLIAPEATQPAAPNSEAPEANQNAPQPEPVDKSAGDSGNAAKPSGATALDAAISAAASDETNPAIPLATATAATSSSANKSWHELEVSPDPMVKRQRRARLRLTRIDPWSVMKTTFLFSVAAAIILILSVWLILILINASGMLGTLESAINDVVANPESGSHFAFRDYISQAKVVGLTTLIAAANVVIFTALGTLFAFLYNLSANILGGLELTLSED